MALGFLSLKFPAQAHDKCAFNSVNDWICEGGGAKPPSPSSRPAGRNRAPRPAPPKSSVIPAKPTIQTDYARIIHEAEEQAQKAAEKALKMYAFGSGGSNLPGVPSCNGGALPNENLAYGGLFFGNSIGGESYGHTPRFADAASNKFVVTHSGCISSAQLNIRTFKAGEFFLDDGKGYNPKMHCQNSDVQCKLAKMRNGGYHWGDGGTLVVDIEADDGNGAPTGQPLSSLSAPYKPLGPNPQYVGTRDNVPYYVPGSGQDQHPVFKFGSCAPVEAGKTYHIVVHQLTPQSGQVVMNGTYVQAPFSANGNGPGVGGSTDVLYRQCSTCDWVNRVSDGNNGSVIPNYGINYTDGFADGSGYIGVGGGKSQKTISGSTIVRQTFSPPGGTCYTVNGFWVRMGRNKGDLTVKLKQGGTTLQQGTVPGSNFPTVGSGYEGVPVDWTFVSLPTTKLQPGQQYSVEFSSPNGSFWIGTSEPSYGGVKYDQGFGPSGQAQISGNNGGSWNSWTRGQDFGSTVTIANADLPVLFTMDGGPQTMDEYCSGADTSALASCE